MNFSNWIRQQFAQALVYRYGQRRRQRRNRAPGVAFVAEVQTLEPRVLLDASPNVAVAGPAGTSSHTGFTPGQIRLAYGFDRLDSNNNNVNNISFNGTLGDGTGTTIAIVDPYVDPNLVGPTGDLHNFDAAFGLTDPPTLTTIDEKSNDNGVNPPPPNSNWALETALDVEWAHAIAPKANILLVEAASSSFSDLMTAVDTAASYPGVNVVSMSFGLTLVDQNTGLPVRDSHGNLIHEDPNEAAAWDQNFVTPANHGGVTFVAASGDDGQPSYPALSPNVLSVGGTTLTLNSNNTWNSETGWNQTINGNVLSSGGGISADESQPVYQKGIVTQNTTQRTNPDVAYDASGFSVYDSFDNGSTNPWSNAVGTSAGAPQWAALVAIADQGRALAGESSLDGPTQTLPSIYALPTKDFHDVTTGSSAGTVINSAAPGYDLMTGLGTPIANNVVHDLVEPGTNLNLAGSWTVYDSSGAPLRLGSIAQTGFSLTFTNGNSNSNGNFLALNQVQLGSLTGTLDLSTSDMGRITWSDGTYWLRNSLSGEYAVSTPGSNVITLESITQSGTGLTFNNGTSNNGAATISGVGTISVTTDNTTATFADGKITFASTGTFAHQVWTKLDLPSSFRNVAGNPVEVVQNNGGSLTFFNKFGDASLGTWIGPTRIKSVAYNEMVTIGSGATAGELLWADGSVWSVNSTLGLNASGSGATTISAAPNNVFVNAYLNGSGQTVYLVEAGNSVLYIGGNQTVHLGTFSTSNPYQASSDWILADGSVDTATFVGDQIFWKDGGTWTKTTSSSSPTIRNYTNAFNIPVYVVDLHVTDPNNGGKDMLALVDGRRIITTGDYADSTHAAASTAFGTATFTSSSVTFNGDSPPDWTAQNNFAPSPDSVVVTAYTNGNPTNPKTVYLVQDGSALLFIGGDKTLHVGSFLNPTQASTDWTFNGSTDKATFQNNQIVWDDGSSWTEIPVASASYPVNVTSYVNGSNKAVYTVVPNFNDGNPTPPLAFIDGLGRIDTGSFSDATHASTPVFTFNGGPDTATFNANSISWVDGSTWTKTTALTPVNVFAGPNGSSFFHFSITIVNGTLTLTGLDGNILGYTGTVQNGQITWTKSGSPNIIWDDLDFNALHALFESAVGYP